MTAAVRAMHSTQPVHPGPMLAPTHNEEGGGVLIMPVPLQDGPPVGVSRSYRKTAPTGQFRRKAMYKYELANWYGVCRKEFVAHYIPQVIKKLRKKGYTDTTRYLSLAMVNIICDHLDQPADGGSD